MQLKRKGQQISIFGMLTAAIALVVLVVGSGFGINILAEQRTDNTSVAEGTAYDDGITGVGKFPAKSSLIASIIIMVFVIGLLLSLGRMGGR